MLNKQFDAEFKALTAEDGARKPGEFEALVAVYGNVDREGDRVKSGAFDESLASWKKAGDPIPVVLAHGWDDPWKHIGYADPADVESIPGRGLHVKRATLDIEDNPTARQVYRLMQRRTLKEFSFGYRVPQGGERKAQDGAYDLVKLDLIEFGPCLKGVNEETELLAIKSELEAGRRRESGEEPTIEERLRLLESAPSRGKAYVTIAGTIEERQQAVRDAVVGAYGPAKGWVDVEGTYEDRVVYRVNADGEEPRTFEATYEVDVEGAVTIGVTAEVEVTAVVERKADEPETVEVEAEAKAQCPECGKREQTFGHECEECGIPVTREKKSETAPVEPDYDLLLREQSLAALMAECADVLAKGDPEADDAARRIAADEDSLGRVIEAA